MGGFDNSEKEQLIIEQINISSLNQNTQSANLFFIVNTFAISFELIIVVNVLLAKYVQKLKAMSPGFMYASSLIMSLLCIGNAIIALSQLIESVKKSRRSQDAQNNKYRDIIDARNAFILASTLAWITVYGLSISMLLQESEKLAYINMWIAIVAPLLGIFPSVFVIAEEISKHKDENSERGVIASLKENPLLFLAIFSALFEIIHLCCHIVEAVELSGNVQNLMSDFANMSVITLQICIGIAVIASFGISSYFENSQVESVKAVGKDKNV